MPLLPTPSPSEHSQTLRFVLDDKVVCIERPAASMTVLDYLREVAGLTGTKEGCAEGDCGACTVVLGEMNAACDHIHYRAINSCIRFLPTLDGKALVSVESLQATGAPAHPVQQSLIDHHASQCGFCTPGFVMSLFALYMNEARADREQVVTALAGNLCRCTGYRPIIDAGMHQWDYPPPVHWSRDEARSPTRIAALRSIARDSHAAAASLQYPGFHAPRSLDELAAALEAQPESLVLAGGTDIGVWVTQQYRELPPLLYLGNVAALNQIEQRAQELWIGAAVTIAAAWTALLAHYPALAEQAARFASPPIRNSATLCGNLANGSPIGDCIPTLIAIGATLELRRGAQVRRVALEHFYLDYQKKDLQSGEFVTGVAIALPQAGQKIASYKVSKRIDQDISGVCATFCITQQHGALTEARLAYGGMAATARRAPLAERALLATGWSTAGIDAAIAALASDFTPLSDMRASAGYRLQVAGNLLRRFYQHQADEPAALRLAH